MRSLTTILESTGPWAPWAFFGLFIAASLLMVWRLEAMTRNGLGGTVLGTLVMPYCSGIGNLMFAILLARNNGDGAEVVVNCLVNNVTNLTLLIGIPTMIFGMNITGSGDAGKKSKGEKKGKSDKQGKGEVEKKVNRLSMMLTLVAVLFFTGVVWALARDGKLDFSDGLVLVGAFLFWQCFHVYDVLKANVQQNKALGWLMIFDFALLIVGGYGIYLSTDWLMNWGKAQDYAFLKEENGMGWISGFLMVLPNAMLALYYSWRGKPDVTYASQVGDGHICIPLCIGLFALFHPITIPKTFELGVQIIAGATVVHLVFMTLLGRLPRFVGVLLVGAYGYFLFVGLFK
ncbi:MAG: sodium:calcium symporter [Verrucomicrobiota bacterium]